MVKKMNPKTNRLFIDMLPVLGVQPMKMIRFPNLPRPVASRLYRYTKSKHDYDLYQRKLKTASKHGRYYKTQKIYETLDINFNCINYNLYYHWLEVTISDLRQEKETLNRALITLSSTVITLNEEIQHLKNALLNKGSLATMLKKKTGAAEAQFISKDMYEKNNQYPDCKKTRKNSDKRQSKAKVGVCLHVSDGLVSLEFCSECSQKISDTRC